jgi:hypothetical protein
LSLPNLIELLLNNTHQSIKSELNDFFKKKSPASYARQLLTTGAFTKARSKFKETAFIELLQQSTAYFYQQIPHKKRTNWYGFRTLAVDGSDLEVPDFPALAEAFGVQSNDSDVLVPMAKLSLLYDTTLNMPIDAQLDRKHASERDLAVCHLAHTQENDLLLYDRGYYAYWLVLQHVLLKREFCFRLKRNANTQVKTFLKSGKKQTIITLEPTQDMRQKALDRDLEITPIRVRLIRIKTTKGYYVLMTSLTDIQHYPAKDFYDLYHLRWRVEEGFKQQKAFLDVEDFSGRTVHSIKQDVHASVLSHALIAMECFASIPLIKAKVKERKRCYKINFSEAINLFKSRIVEGLNGCLNTIEMYLWLKVTAGNLTIIKPDRSFKREKVRCKRKKHRNGYKV